MLRGSICVYRSNTACSAAGTLASAVEPFIGPDLPGGSVLGGTPKHATDGWTDVGGCELIDDGRWHQAEVDVHRIHQTAADIHYLRRFFFLCQWGTEGQQFWFDNFEIAPE